MRSRLGGKDAWEVEAGLPGGLLAVAGQPWRGRGRPLPIRASLLEEFHGSSLRPSWRSVVFGQPGSSSFPSKDPSF